MSLNLEETKLVLKWHVTEVERHMKSEGARGQQRPIQHNFIKQKTSIHEIHI